MSLIKNNKALVTCLLIIVSLFGVSLGGTLGGTVHEVGDWNDWSDYGYNYEAWASSRTFHVGDSLVFQFNKDLHDVTQVTHNDFEMCDTSKPLERYHESVLIHLSKPGLQSFICGFPGHCQAGQKLEILVLPASLGPVAAPLPTPVRSSSPSPVNNIQMGPSPAPAQSAASSTSSVWIGFFNFLPLLCLLILV